MVQSLEDDEPKAIQLALSSFYGHKWKKTMEEKMKSMKINKVWTSVDLPKGYEEIGNKWVLKLKSINYEEMFYPSF